MAKYRKTGQTEVTFTKALCGISCSYFLGHGVFAKRNFDKGDFLLHYQGELLSYKKALSQEKMYSAEERAFMYYFKNSQSGCTMW